MDGPAILVKLEAAEEEDSGAGAERPWAGAVADRAIRPPT